MDFIRDPLWQFVGAVLATLAIIITIVLYLLQRRYKTLAYEIISRTPVLSTSEEIAGKLQILFQGEPVREVHLLVLRLTNNGNVPVISSDYEREISFTFIDCDKILSAEISETTPPKLQAEILVKEKGITIKPLLLNPGDSLTLKTLISEFKNNIDIDGRVVGVKTIEKKTEPSFGWSLAFMLVGLVLFSIGLITISTRPSQYISLNETLINTFIFATGYGFMAVGIASNPRAKKRIVDVIRRAFTIKAG